ncbi:carbon-nitrogen hydrolase family protein [Halosaccharopolyspora lacisalsi]|uniref:carbon-nitrogen hydrolase family protein n=1 Tax=Halosaccharopolyspora lacisalsi TaxID=1000566 RepID=UPI002E2D950F|nr:carbon-nitrogen hydrolase family protein [Halosaccharopolyspora lacisalsi]
MTLVQETQHAATAPTAEFAAGAEALLAEHPRTRLLVYPELHLCGVEDSAVEKTAQLQDAAEPLHGPRGKLLAELAGDLGVWLVPGSVCERGENGELFNTALAYSPRGELAAWYRKVFPWRPYEPYVPGDRFVVCDVPGIGRIGFSICYDSWFPEVARHLAWMGAEVIVNPVRTTTGDRAQELVLARAHAIANQVFVLSVNTAGPLGAGRSLIADPEGHVRAEAPGAEPTTLTDVVDLDDVTRVRDFGTAGLNRMWAQFTDADAPIDLPLYQGRIDPRHWNPATPDPTAF